MYKNWNFAEPPFQTTALSANERGDRLLIGRKKEVEKFSALLAAPPRAVTIEGANGVGKTSLVNVAVFRELKKYLETGAGTLFVPALQPLQLSEDQNAEDFLDSVYGLIARTLIRRAREIRALGQNLPSTRALDQ